MRRPELTYVQQSSASWLESVCCAGFIKCREKQQRKKEVWSMGRKVITISRQCGSGGHMIGKMVAEQWKIPFYDKKLIAIVSERSGFSTEVIEQQGEYVPTSWLFALATNLADKWAFGQKGMSLPDQIYAYQKELIREIADAEACVIVGRCADYILRNHPDCVHVFVYGDLENRKTVLFLDMALWQGMPKSIS